MVFFLGPPNETVSKSGFRTVFTEQDLHVIFQRYGRDGASEALDCESRLVRMVGPPGLWVDLNTRLALKTWLGFTC